MVSTLEPRESVVKRVVGIALKAALALGVVYMVLHETDEDLVTVSPSEMRRVIQDMRSSQVEKLGKTLAEMRAELAEMRGIRDHWLKQVGVEGEADQVLEELESAARTQAAQETGDDIALEDLYGVCRAVEQDMVTLYREFLAARMVDVRPDFTYEEAYEQSATPRPTRPGLDVEALYRDITTTREGGGLPEFKREIKKSTVETREMRENVKKLLAFTKKSNTKTGDGLNVDLSAADVAMIGYNGPELMPDELDFTHTSDVGNFESVAGRRLVTGGKVSEWMYVDSWYIIGPFPGDRRREKMDTRFGPEANVNLDDVFTGKNGRKITWEYKRTGHVDEGNAKKTAFWKIEPKVVDTYAIYYAYTEIYSDTDREVWMATGTDDYGKLWINDKAVWISPKNRKPYNATENMDLYALKQGQNKILYRVENAGGTMGFSLLMRLAE